MNPIILQAQDGAQAAITAYGAHICSWIPAGGDEQLFFSKTSEIREGVAMRGGVPVIFPQFAGLGALPKHGFARTAMWRLLRAGQTASGAARAEFELNENIASLQVWPYVFHAELTVTVVGSSLDIRLSVQNTGDTGLSFTAALHTYFAVGQIADVTVHGLAGLPYRDSVSGVSGCIDHDPMLRISGEIDRIYANAPRLLLCQPRQTTLIQQSGFADAVVWNPGPEKAATLADLEPGGYERMLCIEAAAIMQPVVLAPGASWSGNQSLTVKRT
ncbi:D-hexose-6-phosphate mutarotase [Undibacterium sp. Jales W-56]|uniref:D-hexose-6-phosphate mutarotase n=1 Tax=Undibacterium sp. Jales W-56 TaxID=2897325 RepID=UPI0021D0DCC4|nr:D-hexose-6-phosphate mutarotase [Undibacterium sp. Jales W-56]MCU6434394.1 D-hexose-6-phosphate mutarotase [Undibacterium sp. Jales W-56]